MVREGQGEFILGSLRPSRLGLALIDGGKERGQVVVGNVGTEALVGHLSDWEEADLPGSPREGMLGLAVLALGKLASKVPGLTRDEFGDYAQTALSALGTNNRRFAIGESFRRELLRVPNDPDVIAMEPEPRRVLDRASYGYSTSAIASELEITPVTVTSRLRAAYCQLDARGDGQLALTRGYLHQALPYEVVNLVPQ